MNSRHGVLTHEGVDLAVLDSHRHAVERDLAWKCLAQRLDIDEGKEIRIVGHGVLIVSDLPTARRR